MMFDNELKQQGDFRWDFVNGKFHLLDEDNEPSGFVLTCEAEDTSVGIRPEGDVDDEALQVWETVGRTENEVS